MILGNFGIALLIRQDISIEYYSHFFARDLAIALVISDFTIQTVLPETEQILKEYVLPNI